MRFSSPPQSTIMLARTSCHSSQILPSASTTPASVGVLKVFGNVDGVGHNADFQ